MNKDWTLSEHIKSACHITEVVALAVYAAAVHVADGLPRRGLDGEPLPVNVQIIQTCANIRRVADLVATASGNLSDVFDALL